MPKKSLRTDLLARRRAIDHAFWHDASTAAQLRLISLEVFSSSVHCTLFTDPAGNRYRLLFSKARAEGKAGAVSPRLRHNLQFRGVNAPEQCNPGAFGILEPCRLGEDHTLETADLIVVPGVAFDLQGHRIGLAKATMTAA